VEEFLVNDTLLLFLEDLSKTGEEHDARESSRHKQMLNITADTGRFLWILVHAMAATRILEVGTSNAFSTIWLADAAQSTGGRVTTLEVDPEKISLARANLSAAGLEDVVDIIEGPAADNLFTLSGPFDLVFLDADRSSYLTYLDMIVPKLRAGGLLIADNAVSHAHEMESYLARVKSHSQLFAVTVPIGNGEEVALKIGNLTRGGRTNAM
jgi:predicted O-methyltransferase YrrM